MIKTRTGNSTLMEAHLILLQEWLKAADSLEINEPCSIVLAIVDSQKRLSTRMVLLKIG